MTKEELKQEAEENCVCIDFSMQKMFEIGYIAGAEPREKQIEILSKHILELQADKGRLTDRVKELEAQIEKMKLCDNCKKQGEIITCWKCENHSNWECIK